MIDLCELKEIDLVFENIEVENIEFSWKPNVWNVKIKNSIIDINKLVKLLE